MTHRTLTIISMLALCLALWLLYGSQARRIEAGIWLIHTQEVLMTTNAAEIALLSGDSTTFDHARAVLRANVADSPAQVSRIDALRGDIRADASTFGDIFAEEKRLLAERLRRWRLVVRLDSFAVSGAIALAFLTFMVGQITKR